MRFLANENIPYDAILALRDKGQDVLWIHTEAPGSNDADVLKRAVAEERIVITFDKDFGELAFHSRLPAQCGIILLRIPEQSPAYIAKIIATAIESRTDWEGHFSVIEEQRIRMKKL
jgi:predicted nuclease of predicted toxin-antitoxin system